MALKDRLRYLAVRNAYRGEKEQIGACQVCARPYDPDRPGAHHFDHTDPSTKTKVYRGGLVNVGMRHGIDAMLAEIRLCCEMLCAPCHRWKTRFDRRAA